jgi:hypothetical protein
LKPAAKFSEYVQNIGLVQGDQIGKILAHWAVVYSGKLFTNYKRSINDGAIYPMHQLNIQFDKNGLGYILGNFLQTHLDALFPSNPLLSTKRRY